MKKSIKPLGVELSTKFLEGVEKLRYLAVGLSPILMNNGAGRLLSGSESGIRKPTIPTPEEEAANGLYKAASGQLYMPGSAFRKAVLWASKGKRVGKVSAFSVVSPALVVAREECLLIDPDTQEEIREYIIDTRRAVPPKQGAVRRSRPRIDRWACEVEFEFYQISAANSRMVDDLMVQAGMLVGVGNYRPEKGGSFGRFKVVKL